MAIEKIRKTKFEISPQAAAQLGVAAVLVVLSIILGYLAYARWRFRVNLVSGYENYDSNQVANARKDLEAALSWKPDHTGARELLAKILCDLNQLEGAEGHYNRLLDQGYDAPQVHVGLGVVYLKKADGADAKGAAALLKQARESFERAGPAEVPDAAIGLGHCELLQAERLSPPADPKRLDAAVQRFVKIRQEMSGRPDYRADCSREGIVDYYAGLGKAYSFAATPEDRSVAAAAFRSCYQLVRRWPLPMANILAMETRKFAEGAFGRQEMLAFKPEALALRREMELWKTQRDTYGSLREPWLNYTFALAKAFLDAGAMSDYETLVRELTSGAGFENRLEPFLFDAGTMTRLVLSGETAVNVEQLVAKASGAYKALLGQSVIRDESARLHRALACNNCGWMEAWLGSYHNNNARLQEAQRHLTEAVRLFPDDYVFNRNLCVVLKRLKRPEKECQPYRDKARAAEKGALAEEFPRFEQYMEGR